MAIILTKELGIMKSLFDEVNKKWFNDELPEVVITTSADITRGSYGWCTTFKSWRSRGMEKNGGYYEINITAEYLDRKLSQIVATMIHELVHLRNIQLGIQDCSRGNTYHNSKFKELAEKCGLLISKQGNYGWSKTALNDEGNAFVAWFEDEYKLSEIEFLSRKRYPNQEDNNSDDDSDSDSESDDGEKVADKTKKKSSTRKYVCPVCGTIIRATKEVKVECYECKELFVEEV